MKKLISRAFVLLSLIAILLSILYGCKPPKFEKKYDLATTNDYIDIKTLDCYYEYSFYMVYNYNNYNYVCGFTEEGLNQRELFLNGNFGMGYVCDNYIDYFEMQKENSKIEKIYLLQSMRFVSPIDIGDNIKIILNYDLSYEDYRCTIKGDIYAPAEYAEEYGMLPANVSFYLNYEKMLIKNDIGFINQPYKQGGYYWIDDIESGEKITYIPEDPHRRSISPPSKDINYRFMGWYTEPEGIHKWDFENDIMGESYYVDGELVEPTIDLFAKWEEISEGEGE